MKNLLFGLIATVLFTTNIEAKDSVNMLVKNELENVNCDARKIDMTIKDDSGGVWHIYGTIDIGFGGINGYDITVTHNGHTYHFHGKMARTVNKDGSFSTSIEGDLTENDKIIDITPLIRSVLIKTNDQFLKEG